MDKQIQLEKSKFGKRLRQLRKHRKLTQIDLELLCGVNNADISRIENGDQNIEFNTVVKFAISLKVPVKELFNYTEELP